MSFLLYMIGLTLAVGGIAWGLVIAGMDGVHVAIACVILLGVGIMVAVSQTRARDTSS